MRNFLPFWVDAYALERYSQIGICNYLKRVPYGLRNYRFLVPLDILSKYNLQPKNIWDRIHGKPSEEFFDAVLEIACFAKKCFEDAVPIFENLKKQGKIHPEAFRAFLKVIEIEMFLKNLQKQNFNLFFKLPFLPPCSEQEKAILHK